MYKHQYIKQYIKYNLLCRFLTIRF